jgi:hypothetical protein
MGSIHRDRYIIRSGSFLKAYCPECEKGLNDNNHIVMTIVNLDGEEGMLKLSPYLNTFTNESTVRLPDSMSVRDLKCSHCDASFIIDSERCPQCESKLARIKIQAMHNRIDFFICSKRGCKWHGLDDQDIKDIVLEDSEEW